MDIEKNHCLGQCVPKIFNISLEAVVEEVFSEHASHFKEIW